MKIAIIIFPGSNCDRDMIETITKISGKKPHIIWHKDTEIPNIDLIILPGGFSYGDYLRCGAIAAHSPIMESVIKHANNGGYILGVCNGFQILTETGLLPGTLICNSNLKFINKIVNLKIMDNNTIFTKNYGINEVIKLPIAHHDGCYILEENDLKSVQDSGQIAFKYSNFDGEITPKFCPNGAVDNIAGIYDKSKRILGMMPHPERACEEIKGLTDGYKLFKSLLGI